jgi:AraC-like DNA-binding protein
LWTRGAAIADAPSHRILPDGCADIVVGFSATKGGELAAAYAVGTMTRPLVVPSSEHAAYIGVRFRPGFARTVFGIPARELTDERADIALLWRDTSPALALLHEAQDATSRLRAMEALLLRRFVSSPGVPSEVEEAIRRITGAAGNLSIAALGPALGVTRQHLTRRFADCVGIPPKSFARIVRARRVLAHTRGRSDVDWAEIAVSAGYFDQAHLVGDLRALTGLTPGQWAGAAV